MRASSHLLVLLAAIAMALGATILPGSSQTLDAKKRDGVFQVAQANTGADLNRQPQGSNRRPRRQSLGPRPPRSTIPALDKSTKGVSVAAPPAARGGSAAPRITSPPLPIATPQDPGVLRRRFTGGRAIMGVGPGVPVVPRPATAAPAVSPRPVSKSVEILNFDKAVRIDFTNKDGSPAVCTGLLLNAGYRRLGQVLTAAHCSCGELDSYRFTYLRAGGGPDEDALLASVPVRYADYSCRLDPEQQIGRDLALLMIRRSAEGRQPNDERRAEETSPVAVVASMHQVFDHTKTQKLVGVGYGKTDTEDRPTTPKAVLIDIASFFCAGGIVANSACASFREFSLADLTAPLGGRNRADSCSGDSGGPIYWVPTVAGQLEIDQFVLERDLRFLVGITSRALDGVQHNPGTTCGGGGIYTAVGHPDVVRWLAANNIVVEADFR